MLELIIWVFVGLVALFALWVTVAVVGYRIFSAFLFREHERMRERLDLDTKRWRR